MSTAAALRLQAERAAGVRRHPVEMPGREESSSRSPVIAMSIDSFSRRVLASACLFVLVRRGVGEETQIGIEPLHLPLDVQLKFVQFLTHEGIGRRVETPS